MQALVRRAHRLSQQNAKDVGEAQKLLQRARILRYTTCPSDSLVNSRTQEVTMAPIPRTPLNIRAGNETAVARAVAQLRHQILRGELPPGRRLSELELASNLGVSRPTVRLALEELERLGLAERRDSGGLRVTVPDADYLAEVSSVALMLWKPALLETEFSTEASTTAEVIDALHRMLALIERGHPEDGAAFTAAFFDIFTPIVRLTGNRVWLNLHLALQTRAALGVRTFSNALDIAGIRAWATAIEQALLNSDQRGLHEAFVHLTELSGSFSRNITDRTI